MAEYLLLGSVLLLGSILLSKTSYRFGVPALILFLVTGVLAGSEGIGGIEFNNYELARFLGNAALIFILFSGGLETNYLTVKPILRQGVVMSTAGVMLSVFVVGGFIWVVSDFTLLEGLLVGAIVSSTDAAAVFGVFRSKKMGIKHNLRPLLELESGSNDPMAFVMTTMFIYLLTVPDVSFGELVVMFIKSLAFGAFGGYLFGKFMLWLINRIRLDTEGLYPVLAIALALLTFSATDIVGGNGFLAVYISAVILGNNKFVYKKNLIRFNDGLAWLMQVVMFLMLGLLVNPSQIVPVIGIGLVISLFIIFVARPLVVFLCLSWFKMDVRDYLFISWGGLRGAVPIVFATYALVSGVPQAGIIFNIVFFISVSSVLIQGSTLPYVSDLLKLSLPHSSIQAHPLDYEVSESFQSELVEIQVERGSPMISKRVADMRLPRTLLIILILKNGKYFAPNGNTIIEQGDRLTLMSDNEQDFKQVMELCSCETGKV